MIRTILFGILALIGVVLFMFNSEVLMATGMVILILGFIVFITSRNAEDMAKWVFLLIFLIIFTIVAIVVFNSVSASIVDTQTAISAKAWAIGIGLIVSAVLTVITLILVTFISAIYVLALPTTEDASLGEAFAYVLSLILNTHGAWILVKDGEIAKSKPKGRIEIFGGPGKVIVSPGSAVITERAGKIIGTYGAGVHKMHKKESIRTTFDLKPQFKVHNLENVITADQVPLKMNFGIGYRIKPAEKPYGTDIIKDNAEGYAVSEETLHKAAFNNGKFGWQGFGDNAPVAQLRDQIMRYELKQLLDTGTGSATPTAKDRQIAKIEDEIKTNLNGFDTNLGVLITTIDIREITLPERLVDATIKKENEKIKNESSSDLLKDVIDRIKREYGDKLTAQEQIKLAQDIIQTIKLTETKGTKIIKT